MASFSKTLFPLFFFTFKVLNAEWYFLFDHEKTLNAFLMKNNSVNITLIKVASYDPFFFWWLGGGGWCVWVWFWFDPRAPLLFLHLISEWKKSLLILFVRWPCNNLQDFDLWNSTYPWLIESGPNKVFHDKGHHGYKFEMGFAI